MIYFNSISLRHFRTSNIAATVKSVVAMKTLAGLARRIMAHKQMHELQCLDDHMLKDIGLYRSDLDWAVQQSGRIDPLVALQARRDETLHAEHLASAKSYCKAVARQD